MREIDYRSSSHRSRHSSRSRSRDRDRDRDYYSRRKRSKSRSRKSKSRRKKSKKKHYRRSPSSSRSSSNSSSSRSRESARSSKTHRRRGTPQRNQPQASEKKPPAVQTPKPVQSNLLNVIPEKTVLEEIESDTFTAKPFFSSTETKKLPEKVIIDLNNETISIEGKVEDPQPEQPELFYPDFIGDYRQKLDQWIKKLYTYRQKAFQK